MLIIRRGPGISLGCPRPTFVSRLWPKLFLFGLITLFAAWGAGCSSVSIQQQRLLALQQMQETDRLAFSDWTPLSSQVEPGAANTGGGVASGCSSCR